MKRFQTPTIAIGLSGGLLAGLSSAAAAPPWNYEVFEIRPDQLHEHYEARAWGMNNDGAVVGEYVWADSGGTDRTHAFVWLPQSNMYGTSLDCGFHDLTELISGQNSYVHAVARDISDDGLIVGYTYEAGSPNNRSSRIWCLSGDSWADPSLSTTNDVAWSVSNGSAAAIAGWYSTAGGGAISADDVFTAVPTNGWGSIRNGDRGYTLQFDSADDPCSDLGAFTSLTYAKPGGDPDLVGTNAYDIEAPLSLLIGGRADHDGSTFPCNPACPHEQDCAPGLLWVDDSVTVNAIPAEGWQQGNAEGRVAILGVNESGNMVGAGFADLDVCSQHAVYWNSITQLEATLLPTTGSDSHIAYAITEPFVNDRYLFAVGIDLTLGFATLWTFDNDATPGGDALTENWSATHVSDHIICPSTTGVVSDASDVNDHGLICGTFIEGSSATERAVVLIPRIRNDCCFSDIDGLDGAVGVEDLLLLLASWGECGIQDLTTDNWADVNRDFVIDVSDLLELLGNWGPCGGSASVPETVQDCLEMFSVGSVELEKCLEAVGLT